MERLYAAYEKLSNRGKSFHAELSTNYRCHNGILMLPSYLFYESTLLSRSRVQTHPDYHYPLVFVCSSLDETNIARGGTDMDEADCVLKEIEKYLQKSASDDVQNSVCIMSSSENQVCRLTQEYITLKFSDFIVSNVLVPINPCMSLIQHSYIYAITLRLFDCQLF